MTTSVKTCFKCGAERPLTDFYKHSQMKDGTVNKCKECNKKDVRDNRKDKIEYYRQWDKERNRKEERLELRRKYARTPKGRECKKEGDRRYEYRYPHRIKASRAVSNAVKNGRLEKPNICSRCGSDNKIEAHHWSYKPENWLDVVWLCEYCHKEEHVILRYLEIDPDE